MNDTPKTTDEQEFAEMRAFVARLFGRDPDAAPPETPPRLNVVSREGQAVPKKDTDLETRRYVAHLFKTPDRDHI